MHSILIWGLLLHEPRPFTFQMNVHFGFNLEIKVPEMIWAAMSSLLLARRVLCCYAKE